MNKKNIIMIGMPASGKSTIGVILAKTMGKAFLDTDLLIQEHEGLLLQEIINQKGHAHFRKVEEHVLASLETEGTVVATGGSAVYYDGAMEHLGENGIRVYLSLSLPEITKRLSNIKTRGITMGPGETLADLYAQRLPLYERYADITIETEGLSVEQSVEKIISALETYSDVLI